jgi:hypothetical protein
MKRFALIALVAVAATAVFAQPAAPANKPPVLSDHARADIARHRAMALAHEAAARCLESGQSEDNCHKALQASCKGLAIGKVCGLRHQR